MLFELAHVCANLAVICSTAWLLAGMDQLPLVDYLQVQLQELTRGNGCTVSIVRPDFFEFTYFLTFCDIRVYEQQSGTFSETLIT